MGLHLEVPATAEHADPLSSFVLRHAVLSRNAYCWAVTCEHAASAAAGATLLLNRACADLTCPDPRYIDFFRYSLPVTTIRKPLGAGTAGALPVATPCVTEKDFVPMLIDPDRDAPVVLADTV